MDIASARVTASPAGCGLGGQERPLPAGGGGWGVLEETEVRDRAEKITKSSHDWALWRTFCKSDTDLFIVLCPASFLRDQGGGEGVLVRVATLD